jgi:hypothetical protein
MESEIWNDILVHKYRIMVIFHGPVKVPLKILHGPDPSEAGNLNTEPSGPYCNTLKNVLA